ncbi:MAG: hypothetical protein IT281_01440 [Ignavibacteria bacterium]|nr:hypothetical protein [Ignavibacteria bacterium]
MKEFNEELNRDITLLKSLHAKKDKTEFNHMKQEFMKKHNISKATIYREMKKDVPGFYKVPNYNPPVRSVCDREIRMVKELLSEGRQVSDIIRIMGEELGTAYNWDRFDMVRAMAERIPNPEGPYETAFAKGGHLFLITLFNIEYMAYGTYKTLSINGHDLRFSRETFDVLCLCVQRDNPPPGEDMKTTEMREELIDYYKLRHTKQRTLHAMYRNPQAPSTYAVKCMEESLEKMKLKDRENREKSKYLLHKSKMGMIDQFYGEEYLNEPSEYEPNESELNEFQPGRHEVHDDEGDESNLINEKETEKNEQLRGTLKEHDAKEEKEKGNYSREEIHLATPSSSSYPAKQTCPYRQERGTAKSAEGEKIEEEGDGKRMETKEPIKEHPKLTPLEVRTEKAVNLRIKEGKRLISQTITERRRKGKSEIVEIKKYV